MMVVLELSLDLMIGSSRYGMQAPGSSCFPNLEAIILQRYIAHIALT